MKPLREVRMKIRSLSDMDLLQMIERPQSDQNLTLACMEVEARGGLAALRARVALYLSRRLVTSTFKGSRARTRLRKGSGTMDIRASIFCDVRETMHWPMCVFYSAAVERFLRRFHLDATVAVSQCRASGGKGCTMTVMIRGQLLEQPAAEAA